MDSVGPTEKTHIVGDNQTVSELFHILLFISQFYVVLLYDGSTS